MAGISMRDILRLYTRQPLLIIRWFVRLRHLLSPLEALEELVPGDGRILDLGYGHGLLTNYMVLKLPFTTVIIRSKFRPARRCQN